MKDTEMHYTHYPAESAEIVEKRKDDTVLAIIQALDLFMAQATRIQLGGAARILHQAKESLLYFAVEEGLHESDEERFINRHLYNNDMFAVADCLHWITSLPKKTRQALIDMEMSENPCAEYVKALRRVEK